MKTYKGIVKGNTVVLKEKPDVEDRTEALVLVKATEAEEQEIISRQKAMLGSAVPPVCLWRPFTCSTLASYTEGA
jgi:hypothetical protein